MPDQRSGRPSRPTRYAARFRASSVDCRNDQAAPAYRRDVWWRSSAISALSLRFRWEFPRFHRHL